MIGHVQIYQEVPKSGDDPAASGTFEWTAPCDVTTLGTDSMTVNFTAVWSTGPSVTPSPYMNITNSVTLKKSSAWDCVSVLHACVARVRACVRACCACACACACACGVRRSSLSTSENILLQNLTLTSQLSRTHSLSITYTFPLHLGASVGSFVQAGVEVGHEGKDADAAAQLFWISRMVRTGTCCT